MASLIWVAAPHFEAEDAANRVGWVRGDDADDFVSRPPRPPQSAVLRRLHTSPKSTAAVKQRDAVNV